MQKERLTEKQVWEARWERTRLPAIIEPNIRHPIAKEIVRMFQDLLPTGNLSAVEIGGAPGQWVAYLAKYHGYRTSIIEYSETGCQKTKENFELLGLDVNVYKRDFFDELSDLPRFDVVLSLGFIEHFSDLGDVFQRHVNLLGKGGILALGVPNFAGVGRSLLARTAPKMMSRHNLNAMNLDNWSVLESVHGLTPLFKGYIGGFEPKNLKRCEDRTIGNLSIRYFFKTLGFLMSPFPFLRKYNSPNWSAYLLGIYESPL